MRVLRRRLLLGLGTLLLARRGATAGGSNTDVGPTVLARFQTAYLDDSASRPRAFNIELAVSAIDGAPLGAGRTLSFNDVVGERTTAFGFARSAVIRDRLMAEGVGGGTCQVASTLHAAALLAGLDIAERTPHSRPSRYIRMGLDATVVFARVDLKIHNPRPDSVVVRARASKGTLVVWLESALAVRPHVSIRSEIAERLPFPRTVERDPLAPVDLVRVKEHGIPGYRVLRTRDVEQADGRIRRDQRVDLYPPTPEVLVAAPSFDLASLRPPAQDVIEPEAPPPPPPHLVDDPADRPVHIQLFPSKEIMLDNTPR
jgi:hypothetical protein